MGKSEFECDTTVINSDVVEKLKNNFLPDEVIFLTADFLRFLAIQPALKFFMHWTRKKCALAIFHLFLE